MINRAVCHRKGIGIYVLAGNSTPRIDLLGSMFTKIGPEIKFIAYRYFLKIGKPETAREVLPLCTATRVVYTYTFAEWDHIFDLRCEGISGKPHPNAAEGANLIKDAIFKNNAEAIKMFYGYMTDIELFEKKYLIDPSLDKQK